MNMKKILLAGAMILVFLGLASIGWCSDKGRLKWLKSLTPEELAYLTRADQVIHKVNAKHNKDGTDSIITFSMPKEQADAAWTRIAAFMANYGPGMERPKTDFELSTVVAGYGLGHDFSYYAKKMPLGDQVEFTVFCSYHDSLKQQTEWASQNVHLLALFALTGELMPQIVCMQ